MTTRRFILFGALLCLISALFTTLGDFQAAWHYEANAYLTAKLAAPTWSEYLHRNVSSVVKAFLLLCGIALPAAFSVLLMQQRWLSWLTLGVLSCFAGGGIYHFASGMDSQILFLGHGFFSLTACLTASLAAILRGLRDEAPAGYSWTEEPPAPVARHEHTPRRTFLPRGIRHQPGHRPLDGAGAGA